MPTYMPQVQEETPSPQVTNDNKQFHEQLSELTQRLSVAIKERDMTLRNFEENEEMWTKKVQKIQNDQ